MIYQNTPLLNFGMAYDFTQARAPLITGSEMPMVTQELGLTTKEEINITRNIGRIFVQMARHIR